VPQISIRDGIVSVQELYEYVEQQVTASRAQNSAATSTR